MIITMKMSNGDELIAKFENFTADNDLVVSKPRIIFHDGRQGGLAPYVISDPDKTNITINRAFVVTSFESSIDVAKSYMQATPTIQLAS